MLEALYAEVHRELRQRCFLRPRTRTFQVHYHPYAGLRSTIFDRRTHYEVRLGELLRGAPDAVHRGLAFLLIGKIDRRLRPRPEDLAPYRAWSRDPTNVGRHEALRRARGRKPLASPRGQVHDLEVLFHQLNRDYFGETLRPVRLGWSPRTSRRLYGHYDAAHDAIVLNRLLDHPRVPTYVVASVLHHEMLHVKYAIEYRDDGRRVVHPRALRQEERRFVEYAAAKRFLDDLAARRIRLRPLPSLATTPPTRPPPNPTPRQLRLDEVAMGPKSL